MITCGTRWGDNEHLGVDCPDGNAVGLVTWELRWEEEEGEVKVA